MAPTNRWLIKQKELLKNRVVSSASNVIYQTNQTDSPFFNKLPPEIRNNIYVLAVGGGVVHIWTENVAPGKFVIRHTRCNGQAPPPPPPPTYGYRLYGADRDKAYDHCVNQAAEQVSVNALLVCRQFHSEAKLVPYFSNEFRIHHEAFPTFMKSLKPAQKKAIQNLTIFAAGRIDTRFLPLGPIRELTGVKKCGLHLVLDPVLVVTFQGAAFQVPGAYANDGSYDREAKQLARLHITEASVTIHAQGAGIIPGLPCAVPGLSAHLKQILLQDPAHVDREAREAAKAQKEARMGTRQREKQQQAIKRAARGLRKLD